MIFYALSNTHHTEHFPNIEFIGLPKLFFEVGKIYPPKITNIELDKEFNLDISQKPLLDKPNILLPRLSYIGNMVRSNSHRFPNMNTNQKITTNYRIEASYWNEKYMTN